MLIVGMSDDDDDAELERAFAHGCHIFCRKVKQRFPTDGIRHLFSVLTYGSAFSPLVRHTPCMLCCPTTATNPGSRLPSHPHCSHLTHTTHAHHNFRPSPALTCAPWPSPPALHHTTRYAVLGIGSRQRPGPSRRSSAPAATPPPPAPSSTRCTRSSCPCTPSTRGGASRPRGPSSTGPRAARVTRAQPVLAWARPRTSTGTTAASQTSTRYTAPPPPAAPRRSPHTLTLTCGLCVWWLRRCAARR